MTLILIDTSLWGFRRGWESTVIVLDIHSLEIVEYDWSQNNDLKIVLKNKK